MHLLNGAGDSVDFSLSASIIVVCCFTLLKTYHIQLFYEINAIGFISHKSKVVLNHSLNNFNFHIIGHTFYQNNQNIKFTYLTWKTLKFIKRSRQIIFTIKMIKSDAFTSTEREEIELRSTEISQKFGANPLAILYILFLFFGLIVINNFINYFNIILLTKHYIFIYLIASFRLGQCGPV